MISTLERLGYSQQTDEEYRQNVEKALKDIENETEINKQFRALQKEGD